ncbi:MAG: UDP-3-O-(3-hydroxymyristoyl)glucosamine N-acyltransferase [Granulosicoccus sp.]
MKLGELATALGLTLHGDAEQLVVSLAPLDSAGPGELSFAIGRKHLDGLRRSQAGALIVTPALVEEVSGSCLSSADPYASYAQASWLLQPEKRPAAGIHASAQIDETATIAASASIGAFAIIGANTSIGEEVIIGCHSLLANNVHIGANTRLFPGVVVYERVSIGSDCRVQSGAVIGAEGFGYASTANGWQAIQQTGGVQIGDRVHIGANTTIDCGAMDPTVIASGVILDNQIQIAHNVQIGENTAIAGCVGIAGSTKIGDNCQIGGACNIVGHISIADGVVLNAASLVTRSIADAGRYSSGMPLLSSGAWKRSYVILSRLNDLLHRVRKLERGHSRPEPSED